MLTFQVSMTEKCFKSKLYFVISLHFHPDISLLLPGKYLYHSLLVKVAYPVDELKKTHGDSYFFPCGWGTISIRKQCFWQQNQLAGKPGPSSCFISFLHLLTGPDMMTHHQISDISWLSEPGRETRTSWHTFP